MTTIAIVCGLLSLGLLGLGIFSIERRKWRDQQNQDKVAVVRQAALQQIDIHAAKREMDQIRGRRFLRWFR